MKLSHKNIIIFAFVLVIVEVLVLQHYGFSPLIKQKKQIRPNASTSEKGTVVIAGEAKARENSVNTASLKPELIELGKISDALLKSINSGVGSEAVRIRNSLSLNLLYSFSRVNPGNDNEAASHTRYQQYYRNIPVWGQQVSVHRNKMNVYDSVKGSVAKGLESDALDLMIDSLGNANVSINEAVSRGIQHSQQNNRRWELEYKKSEFVLFFISATEVVPAYHLSWVQSPKKSDKIGKDAGLGVERDGFDYQQPVRIIVNAMTSEVIKEWQGRKEIRTVGVSGNLTP